jgi:predicted HTH transcriptional regulator
LRLLARGASAHQKVGKDGNYTLRNRELHIPADTVNDTVFSLIKQDNKITASEMSERLKLSVSTVRRKIKELRNGGKIVRMGGDKTGYWQISE